MALRTGARRIRLPLLHALTIRQRTGRDCVLCGVVLAPGTARDLGPRLVGGLMRFPRACRRHDEEASTQ